MNTPTDICNEALVALGSSKMIGDIQDGTAPARVFLQIYSQCVRKLLRSAHWNFSRRQTPMALIADSTQSTPRVGTQVMWPWTYAYQLPGDCLRARFVPAITPNTSSAASGVPILGTSGAAQTQPWPISQTVPAPFLIGNDPTYPPPSGSEWWNEQGGAPDSQTLVMTNIGPSAYLVYTAFLPYPSVWDSLFRGAMVSYLAYEAALAIIDDKKAALQVRADQYRIARDRVVQARISDGNEGWFKTTHIPDWVKIRSSGAKYGWWFNYDGPGMIYNGWDGGTFGGDGSAY